MSSDERSETVRERRAYVRFVCDLETWCQPDRPEAAPVPVTIEDLSGSGLSLRTDQAFEAGTLLHVQWPGLTEDAHYTVAVCVVRSVGPANGHWTHGCTFVRPLGEDDLQRLGIARQEPGAGDQRRWTRFPSDQRGYYDLVTGTQREQLPARAVDVSPSGIGLLVSQPLEVGSVLSLDVIDRGLTLLVCVIRLEANYDDWRAGCSLIRTLSEEELRAWL